MNKRDRLKDKHFQVIINNKRVRILNYKIEATIDDSTDKEVIILTLITKLYSEVFKDKEIQIQIKKNESNLILKGHYKGALLQPGLKRYIYNIDNE